MTITASFSSSSSFFLAYPSFTTCSASGYGGGLYVSLSSLPSTFSLCTITYSANTATSSGPTLFVHSTSLDYILSSHFTQFLSCNADVTRHCIEWECDSEVESAYDTAIYVAPVRVEDEAGCGSEML